MATAAAEHLAYPSSESSQPRLTDWKKEPTLQQLKYDLENAKQPQAVQIGKIQRWSDLLRVEGTVKPPKVKGRSRVQPKLIRRQAEWRYSALTEPFLGTDKLFKVEPVTFEDAEAARQNALVLNYQFRTKLNRIKFIDDYVRTTVDDGTAILRVGWLRHTVMVPKQVPIWEYRLPQSEEELVPLQQAIELKQADPREYDQTVVPSVKAAVTFWEDEGKATVAVQTGTETVQVEKIITNQPTVEVMNPKNVFFDPSCGGDLRKAMFAVVSFETSKAELLKEGKRYKNLDQIDWSGSSPMTEPDHATNTPDQQTHDSARRKLVAYEYWGFYDIDGNGSLTPIVISWIGNTVIRMERNPFPDQKLPFIVVNYMPVKRELYGEPDAELLEDQQAVAGAVTRGMIDLLGRSANAQQGFAKGMLDPLNRKRFEGGQDYEFNPNMPPQQGHINHTYPEIPQSAMLMLNLQNQEAEALTGVKSFAGGMSGEAYGEVAAGIKGVLDAAAKREMALLRRLAKGVSELGEKIIAMNGEFLSEEETIRITNETFEKVKREDLAGNFDLSVDISTAEVDNAKSQDLGFIFQTVGPNMDFSMTQLILVELCELKRMPVLADKIRKFKPEPDPMAEKAKELELAKLQAELDKINSEIRLNDAKAEQAAAKADADTLEFVNDQTGVKHGRELEKQRAQAEGNQNLAVTKALTTPKKEGEKAPDIEAAVGFNELTNGPRSTGEGPPVLPMPAAEPAPELPLDQLPFSPEMPVDQGMME
jgi:hypothetical protein